MRGPRHEGDYPDRMLDCEFELEPEFQALIDKAEEAGWSAQECYLAIISLCQNHAIGDMQNDAVQEIIDRRPGSRV